MRAHWRKYDELCVKFLSGMLWASIAGQAMAPHERLQVSVNEVPCKC